MAANPSAPGQRYRPEVDGLRALAVLAVILNHLNPAWLPGGWLGVDIFFVISGYVITRSLAERPCSDGRALALNFWRRRIQRLLPALIVCVLLTSLALRLVDPSPGQRLGVGWRALFGLSNITLLNQATQYFGSPAALEPFLHTWSLGVEEQFYLLYPLLVIGSGFGRGSREGARRLGRWLLPLAAGSLGLFLWWSQHQPAAAWFLMPARFWELAAGCLLALTPNIPRVPPAWALLAALVAGLWLPAPLAALTVPAAVLLTTLLIAGLSPGGRIHGLLSQPAVVLVGRMSYSLYLWHWSVMTLARWTVGTSPAAVALQLGLIALLGSASWRWIEEPLRRRRWTARPLTTILLGLSLASGAALAVLGLSKAGDHLYLGRRDSPLPPPPAIRSCDPPNAFRLTIFGDSHADHYRRAVVPLCQAHGVRVEVVSLAGMPYPLLSFTNPRMERGREQNLISRASMRRQFEDVDLPRGQRGLVLLALRSNLYFPAPAELTPHEGKADHLDPISNAPVSGAAALTRWLEDVERLLRSYPDSRFVLLMPSPEFPDLAPIEACTPQWFRPKLDRRCHDSLGRERRRQAGDALRRGAEALARRHPNLSLFDAFATLCPPSQAACPRLRDGRTLYLDDNHLSETGAVAVLEELLRSHGRAVEGQGSAPGHANAGPR